MVRGEIKIGKSPSTHFVLGRGLPGGLGPPCSWEVGEETAGPAGGGSARERWRDHHGAGSIVTGSL